MEPLIKTLTQIINYPKLTMTNYIFDTGTEQQVLSDPFNLLRFINAQQGVYDIALQEILNGHKTSHWIWYIFPQMKGLGRSYNAEYYGIGSLEDAIAYLKHPTLRSRLVQITEAFLKHTDKSATEILGGIDARKVRSCMTLFDYVEPESIFAKVLEQFYAGNRDQHTLMLL